MADASTINLLPGLDSALKTASSSSSAPKKENNKEIGKTEFLQLLVTQLKNQDPLNPMENQEFAVQLAQFSSLEQLMSINNKVGGTGGSGDFGSLASYLGNEVVLNSDKAHVENHDGGRISVDLNQDAAGLRIDLLNPDGSVAETSSVGAIAKGKHTIQLDNLTTASGDYKVRVTATGASGGAFSPQVYTAGIVSGFIPGADPKLIVNGQEISASDIREVHLAPAIQ